MPHGVAIMEKNYSGLAHGTDPSLRDLQGVLGIEALADGMVRRVPDGSKRLRVAVPA